MDEPEKTESDKPTQNSDKPAPGSASEQGSTEQPIPYLPVPHPGPKSPLESHIEKNQYAAEKHEEAMKKVMGKDYKPMPTREISSIIQLHEQAAWEITRSHDEGVLRGRTFVDYADLLLRILKYREEQETTSLLAEAHARNILANTEEVKAFIRATCDIINTQIQDEAVRKAIIDGVIKLYEEFHAYQRASTEHHKAEYPSEAHRFELPPPQSGGNTSGM